MLFSRLTCCGVVVAVGVVCCLCPPAQAARKTNVSRSARSFLLAAKRTGVCFLGLFEDLLLAFGVFQRWFHRTRVQALGCVLYAVCYLKNPFQDAGNLGILNAR